MKFDLRFERREYAELWPAWFQRFSVRENSRLEVVYVVYVICEIEHLKKWVKQKTKEEKMKKKETIERNMIERTVWDWKIKVSLSLLYLFLERRVHYFVFNNTKTNLVVFKCQVKSLTCLSSFMNVIWELLLLFIINRIQKAQIQETNVREFIWFDVHRQIDECDIFWL